MINTAYIEPLLQELGRCSVTKTITKFKTETSSNGGIISYVPKGVKINIINEEIPYYYEVVFVNDEGELEFGRVAKKN